MGYCITYSEYITNWGQDLLTPICGYGVFFHLVAGRATWRTICSLSLVQATGIAPILRNDGKIAVRAMCITSGNDGKIMSTCEPLWQAVSTAAASSECCFADRTKDSEAKLLWATTGLPPALSSLICWYGLIGATSFRKTKKTPLSTRVGKRLQIVWQGSRLGSVAETANFATIDTLSTFLLFFCLASFSYFSPSSSGHVSLRVSSSFQRHLLLSSKYYTFVLSHVRIPFISVLYFCIFLCFS